MGWVCWCEQRRTEVLATAARLKTWSELFLQNDALAPVGVPLLILANTMLRDSETTIKIKFPLFEGVGPWGQRGKSSKTLFLFSRGKRHSKKNLKMQILLSGNFVVIAQAPICIWLTVAVAFRKRNCMILNRNSLCPRGLF